MVFTLQRWAKREEHAKVSNQIFTQMCAIISQFTKIGILKRDVSENIFAKLQNNFFKLMNELKVLLIKIRIFSILN